MAVEDGGFIYLPSGKFEAKKSCSNFSKASLRMGFKGSIAEGPLGLSSAMQYLGWVGQFVESLMIKIQNVGVGDGEVKKTNFQQHPQGLLESQKTPPHRPPVGQDHLPC